MRSIDTIYNEMLAAKTAQAALNGLTSSSVTAIWRLIFYVCAIAIWSFEQILGVSMAQMDQQIRMQKIHSLTWYSELAKKFQLGHALPFGETTYTTIDENAQIVKYCAVTKTPGGLRVKIAGETGGDLAPLSGGDFLAFQAYMEAVKGAGDLLFYTNAQADDLKLVLDIYYDPLVLDADGERLDGTNATPVLDAINAYLQTMDFNGRLVPALLVDAIQQVQGVVVPDLLTIQNKYALLAYEDVPAAGVVPNAGYFRIESETINYIPYEQ